MIKNLQKELGSGSPLKIREGLGGVMNLKYVYKCRTNKGTAEHCGCYFGLYKS